MNKSSIKTWFRRNGFVQDGYGSTWRADWQYCHRGGIHYRIRNNEPDIKGYVVDISDDDFDRWANSTKIHAMPVDEFLNCWR